MSKFKKFLIFSTIVIIVIGGVVGFFAYKYAISPNVELDEEYTYLYIKSDCSFQAVLDSLSENNILINEKSFIILSKIKKYDVLVKSGKYKIYDGLNNWNLINLLRSGRKEPVKILVPSVRTLDKLCERIAPFFEFSYTELYDYLNSEEFLSENNLDEYNKMSLFIPNTYEIYWDITAQEFVSRMLQEYENFWTEEKKEKAKNLDLTQLEVTTLASIVQSEQMQHADERPIIAGLYLNRLKKGIRLQSDPTLIFATGDFSIKRVYDYHKNINSPYNTYLYAGLPPGPILLPHISSINAVLNPQESDYLFMCAKEDLSGYHYFATNLTQHVIYAKRYHNALNALNIR